MVVGNMGSSSRMDYTLMGDNVNLGARLEGTNKVYRTNIIISENTYEHVKDHVIVRELDLIRVKGKEQPVVIYELVDVKE
jgi:adenylate cyclase